MSEGFQVAVGNAGNGISERECAQRQCGARTKSGGTCKGLARANGRCRVHGGNQTSGVGHHLFKHGRYSKYVPKNLKRSYEESRRDPELLSLHDDLALVESREKELLGRLSVEQPPWQNVLSSLDALMTADPDDIPELLEQHNKLIRDGAAAAKVHDRTWRQLQEVIEQKSQLAQAEWKRQKELQQLLPVADALTFVRTVLMAAKDTVKDESSLRALQYRINQLLPNELAPRHIANSEGSDSDG